MYKRKDNDIFGTASIGYAPRIENNLSIDPHAAFKKKTEQNYQRYQAKLSTVPNTITGKPLDSSKVNENVNFEEDYHKNRKEMDLQSSIFYPPTAKISRKYNENSQNDPSLLNKPPQQTNFGRKQVFKREINDLPFNNTQARGNSSRLFDLDERIKPKSEENIPLIPLIPHQMKWDQHDSIRYSHINYNIKETGTKEECPQFDNVSQSKSTVFEKKQEIKEEVKVKKSVEKKIQNPKATTKPTNGNSQRVEIKIMKGWDHKFMEGLSKHCKLNNSAILSFETDQESKVTLIIKKSQRWQNVADWLRKDCKLKLRVMN